jgi:hypothetical protein
MISEWSPNHRVSALGVRSKATTWGTRPRLIGADQQSRIRCPREPPCNPSSPATDLEHVPADEMRTGIDPSLGPSVPGRVALGVDGVPLVPFIV